MAYFQVSRVYGIDEVCGQFSSADTFQLQHASGNVSDSDHLTACREDAVGWRIADRSMTTQVRHATNQRDVDQWAV